MKNRNKKSGAILMSNNKVKQLSGRFGVDASRIREIESKAIAKLQQRTSEEKVKLASEVLMDNCVTFLPVIGDKYCSHGRRVLGRRVMVVGASHYCEHLEPTIGCNACCDHFGKYRFHKTGDEWYFGERCERFSHIVLERYRRWEGEKDERRWFGTFLKFYNAFFPSPVSHETRKLLMDLMVSTEYVQGAEVSGPNGNSRVAMSSDRNFDEFKNTVDRLKPDVVIFWGPRAWHEVCSRLGEVNEKDDILHVTLNNRKLTLLRVPHPSSSAFKRDHFREQLKCVGINADRLLKHNRKEAK